LSKIRTYTVASIQQEILGRSYELGSKPVNVADLMEAERNHYKMSTQQEYVEMPIMGVDWGYGDIGYTVVTVAGWNQRNNFQVIYSKRFKIGEEINPQYQLDFILSLARRFGVVQIGCDWGAGWGQNDRLRVKFRNTSEFIHSHQQKTMVTYKRSINRYVLNRTESMSNLFEAIKARRVETYEGYCNDMGQDYLNVSGTVDRLGHVLYTHRPSRPDDAVHSTLYAYIIARITRRDIQPLMEE
jgi:hypothetical protein